MLAFTCHSSDSLVVHPLTLSCPKLPDYFSNISLTKRVFRKYLKENYWSEKNKPLSFKYFSNFCLIPKLLTKVSQVQTTVVKKIYRHNWVNPLNARCSTDSWDLAWILLTHSHLEINLTSVVWTCQKFEINFGMKHKFAKYLKDSCR